MLVGRCSAGSHVAPRARATPFSPSSNPVPHRQSELWLVPSPLDEIVENDAPSRAGPRRPCFLDRQRPFCRAVPHAHRADQEHDAVAFRRSDPPTHGGRRGSSGRSAPRPATGGVQRPMPLTLPQNPSHGSPYLCPTAPNRQRRRLAPGRPRRVLVSGQRIAPAISGTAFLVPPLVGPQRRALPLRLLVAPRGWSEPGPGTADRPPDQRGPDQSRASNR